MTLMENIVRLSRVDGQIRALRQRVAQARTYHQAQLRQIESIDGRISELETRRRQHRARLALAESEAATAAAREEKFRADLDAASTTKQYAAVLTELNSVKAEKSRIDEAMLAEMETIEAIEAEMASLADQRTERQRVETVAAQRLAERTQEVESTLSELEQERVTVEALLPPDSLNLFNAVAESHEGEALSNIEELDRRNRVYCCGACNVNLPLEQVAALTARSVRQLVRCPACGRILCLHEDIRGALAR